MAPLEKRFKLKITKILFAQAVALKKAFLKYKNEKKDNNKGMSEEDADKLAEKITIAISYAIDSGEQTMMTELLPLWLNSGITGNRFFNSIQFGINVDDMPGQISKPTLPGEPSKVPTNVTIVDAEFLDSEGKILPVMRKDYLEWLDTYGTNMITKVNDTTKELTRRIIRKGLINGDSTDSIADELEKSIVEYTKSRAVLIAETETHNSFMYGNFMSAQESGFKYKTYITAGDGRVRPRHVPLNNVRIKIDERFSNGGLYPGDPALGPKDNCRCRCSIWYE